MKPLFDKENKKSFDYKEITNVKGTSGTVFLQNNDVSVLPGKWTDLEIISLLLLMEFVKIGFGQKESTTPTKMSKIDGRQIQ